MVVACIGNVVEWYDFAVYGAFATILAGAYFPNGDRSAGLLASFTVFATAFLARLSVRCCWAAAATGRAADTCLPPWSSSCRWRPPTEVRSTALALSYGLASALVGGTAPVVDTLLVQGTGNPLLPAWYATTVTLAAAVGMLLPRRPRSGHWTPTGSPHGDDARLPLDDHDPVGHLAGRSNS